VRKSVGTFSILDTDVRAGESEKSLSVFAAAGVIETDNAMTSTRRFDIPVSPDKQIMRHRKTRTDKTAAAGAIIGKRIASLSAP
jgi:hypothetical protein